MQTIAWDDFEKVELRVGTILTAEPLPEARKAAFKMTIDFGEFGVKSSSAQLTAFYTPETLVGRQIIGVLNFAPRRIAGFSSEVLVTGFEHETGGVVLAQPEQKVANGAKLF